MTRQSTALRVALGAWAVGGCWSAAPPPAAPIQNTSSAPAAPKDPEPSLAEFGTVDDDGVLQPSAEIPLYGGSAFGWRLELGCAHTVEIDEELRLPAPGDWGSDPEMTISRDGRIARVHSEAVCLDGWIEKTWTVSAGDPPGIWIVRVTAAGFAPQTFRATFIPTIAPVPGPLPSGMTPPAPAPSPPTP